MASVEVRTSCCSEGLPSYTVRRPSPEAPPTAMINPLFCELFSGALDGLVIVSHGFDSPSPHPPCPQSEALLPKPNKSPCELVPEGIILQQEPSGLSRLQDEV